MGQLEFFNMARAIRNFKSDNALGYQVRPEANYLATGLP